MRWTLWRPLFYQLKSKIESLVFKVHTRKILGKNIEVPIDSRENLANLLHSYGNKNFVLVYKENGRATKVLTAYATSFFTLYLMNEDTQLTENVLSASCCKIGVTTKEDGERASRFLIDHLRSDMTISELIDVYNQMLSMTIDNVSELYHFEVDESDFEHVKFTLTRQFPTYYDDEFYMINLTVTAPIADNFEKYYDGFDWDGIGNEKCHAFIEQIRETVLYQELDKTGAKMLNVDVNLGET